MAKHLQRDLDQLKKEILTMGSMVEEAFNKSLQALMDQHPEVAREVVEKDNDIDLKENAIEEECLKMLALHQPVATDLRYIVTVLKVNNDLERMGDYSVNIAERALYLADQKGVSFPKELSKGNSIVQAMVRKSLDSLVRLDIKLAKKVCQEDEVVDAMHREMFQKLQEMMKKEPEKIDIIVPVLSVFRYLERIADLATNIAEDIIFMVEGDIVRHRLD